jgi:ATP-dependent DNA ligase
MTRYFPEVVAGRQGEPARRARGRRRDRGPDPDRHRLEFEALQQRIHPAEPRPDAGRGHAGQFIAFDLLALGDDDLTRRPVRRAAGRARDALADASRRSTSRRPRRDVRSRAVVREFEGAGLDGVVAKPLDGIYQPDKRVMFKIKHERTADCVVAGYRLHKSGPTPSGRSCSGSTTTRAVLANVGVIGAFPMERRRALLEELQPWVTTFDGHPWDWEQAMAEARTPRSAEGSRWNPKKDLSFVPLRPERVVEARYDHMEGNRFRHTGQFVRWRSDRDPRSCTFEQLEEPVSFDLAEILGTG